MFKKFVKKTVIGILWSLFFIYFSNILFLYLWGFNLWDAQSWLKIKIFWNQGGAIKEGKDYCFLIMLLALVPLWAYGWHFFNRIKFLKLLVFPYEVYNRMILKKYDVSSQHFSLKNIGASTKIEDEIKISQGQAKANPEHNADKIREEIQKKLKKNKQQ